MKDGVSERGKPVEVLCKLKLVKNLTSGMVEESKDGKSSEKERVTWRFTLRLGEKVQRTLYLLDIGSAVEFDVRVATREVESK